MVRVRVRLWIVWYTDAQTAARSIGGGAGSGSVRQGNRVQLPKSNLFNNNETNSSAYI